MLVAVVDGLTARAVVEGYGVDAGEGERLTGFVFAADMTFRVYKERGVCVLRFCVAEDNVLREVDPPVRLGRWTPSVEAFLFPPRVTYDA
ncbi:MAG: hypothetical protein IT350_12595 [Deltaproteobacteria bacterium]|nr:hypothetical protein [Deltaproteobacteria bacterium]